MTCIFGGVAMSRTSFRKTLGIPGLLGLVRESFGRTADPVAGRSLSLTDCLMSGLAMFLPECPSLLQFDRDARREGNARSNLRKLHGVSRAPSDTAMRERLDQVDPELLRKAFGKVFAALQRGKVLEDFTWLGHHLLPVDGTGHFSSSSVHCRHCCERHHGKGKVTCHHQMLGAVLVHPERREAFPLAPEPILREDGSERNDCERNAAKRLLPRVRREHPHLRLLVVEDALASNGPHIRMLGELDMRFVLGVKPGDHQFLFDWVKATPGTQAFERVDAGGVTRRCRFLNGAPLNDANFGLEVNFPECRESRPGKDERCFSWVTDIEVTEENAEALMRAGRARWRIGNERQHAEEPGLRLRAQPRPRQEPSGDGSPA